MNRRNFLKLGIKSIAAYYAMRSIPGYAGQKPQIDNFIEKEKVQPIVNNAIDFTNIPEGTKRIEILFNGVSESKEDCLIQIGDNQGIESSRYGLTVHKHDGSEKFYARASLFLEDKASKTWSFQAMSEGKQLNAYGGKKSLSKPLSRIRVTGVSNDRGEIKIIYDNGGLVLI